MSPLGPELCESTRRQVGSGKGQCWCSPGIVSVCDATDRRLRSGWNGKLQVYMFYRNKNV